jgi:hypothetical protein
MSRIRPLKYGHPDCPRAVFNKGAKIADKDPDEWRKCEITKQPIKFADFGKSTPTGWQMDHRIPQSKSGPDLLWNLIPVQTRQNIGQGASFKDKPDALLQYHAALAERRGIKPKYKNLEFKWSKELIGTTIWVKATPTSVQKLARLNGYNRKMVSVTWTDTNWDEEIPLNKDLFEMMK